MNTKTLLCLCLLVTSALVGCTTREIAAPTSLAPTSESLVLFPTPSPGPTLELVHAPGSVLTATASTPFSSSTPTFVPTPEPTHAPCSLLTPTASIRIESNWPTFENRSFGIRLRYPITFYHQTWDTSTFPDKLLSVTFQDQKYRNTEIHQIPNVALNIWDNAEKLDIRTWLARHSTTEPFGTEVNLKNPVFFLWPNTQPVSMTANGIGGICFTSDAMGLEGIHVILSKGKWIVELSYGAFGPDDLGPIYRAMLSSLDL
jgi:hypothetical protein